MDIETCSHETTAGSRETDSAELCGSQHGPNDDVEFFDVRNDFKLPSGIVPEPGFHDVKDDFKSPPGPIPEP
eukprot:12505988-Prorocentrum_lima.AAC.1